jgi:hypothetical protein
VPAMGGPGRRALLPGPAAGSVIHVADGPPAGRRPTVTDNL